MAQFTVTGDVDPFLHVTLTKGEKIFCESDAMVMMEDTLDLAGKLNGGIGAAIMRSFANDESLFQTTIEATRGTGDCLLAPASPGAITILDVAPGQNYILGDGAFVAAESGVEIKMKTQGLGGALFGGTGGFFVGHATGQGKLAVSGMGTSFVLDVEPGKEVIIDNAHAIAWDSNLNYTVGMPNSQNQGLLGRMVNSVTTGEGLTLRFSGQGKVVLCSRNRKSFAGWISKLLPARG